MAISEAQCTCDIVPRVMELTKENSFNLKWRGRREGAKWTQLRKVQKKKDSYLNFILKQTNSDLNHSSTKNRIHIKYTEINCTCRYTSYIQMKPSSYLLHRLQITVEMQLTFGVLMMSKRSMSSIRKTDTVHSHTRTHVSMHTSPLKLVRLHYID